jgi:hypothetical protein
VVLRAGRARAAEGLAWRWGDALGALRLASGGPSGRIPGRPVYATGVATGPAGRDGCRPAQWPRQREGEGDHAPGEQVQVGRRRLGAVRSRGQAERWRGRPRFGAGCRGDGDEASGAPAHRGSARYEGQPGAADGHHIIGRSGGAGLADLRQVTHPEPDVIRRRARVVAADGGVGRAADGALTVADGDFATLLRPGHDPGYRAGAAEPWLGRRGPPSAVVPGQEQVRAVGQPRLAHQRHRFEGGAVG